MQLKSSYDAVIVGAGVIGCNIALEMARAGFRTLNIDKLPAAGYGSTSSSSAVIRSHYSTWNGVAMAFEATHYWEQWDAYLDTERDERGLARFVECGIFVLGDRLRYTAKVIPLFDEIGVPYELLTVADLEARFPSIDLGRYGPPKRPEDPEFWRDAEDVVDHILFCPRAGYVNDPQLAAYNLYRAAKAAGGEFLFNTEVGAIDKQLDRVAGVRLTDGSAVFAPVVVNVAGPHSSVVNEMAGLTNSMRIRTRPLRHETHSIPPQVSFDGPSTYLVGDDDLGTYFRSDAGGQMLLGSQDPDCDPKEWVTDPDAFDRNASIGQWETQTLRLGRRLPTLGIPGSAKGVADLYDVSDDWIPIYDRTDLGGFYVAIGTSGNQFKNSSVAAFCMTKLIEAVEAGHDHDSQPVSVRQRHTGLEVNLGAFSRNRSVTESSSFSVLG